MIKILHMYPDVMNLYGEYANMTILKRFLEECGAEVCLESISLYEDKDISGYDMYYMGAGTESNISLVLKEIEKYKDVLLKAKNDNRVMLFTGSAMEIFGKEIKDGDNMIPALGLSDYTTIRMTFRMTGDVVGHEEKEDGSPDENYIVGFSNKCSYTGKVEHPWFVLEMGDFNSPPDAMKDAEYYGVKKWEGVHENNMFCTHITGPLLVKNPHLLKKFASLLMGNDEAFDHHLVEQELGFEVTLNALLNRMAAQ